MQRTITLTSDIETRKMPGDDQEKNVSYKKGSVIEYDTYIGNWYRVKGTTDQWFAATRTDDVANGVYNVGTFNTVKVTPAVNTSVNFGKDTYIKDTDGNVIGGDKTYTITEVDNATSEITLYDGTSYSKVPSRTIQEADSDGVIVLPDDIARKTVDTNGQKQQESVIESIQKNIENSVNKIVDTGEKFWNTISEYSVNNFLSPESLSITSTEGIFGAPYNFMPIADPRVGSDTTAINNLWGITYADRIGTRLPLCIMLPGKPEMMVGKTDEDKKTAFEGLFNFGDDDGTGSLKDLVEGGAGKYYAFAEDSANYFNYVNTMCNMAATTLGVQDKEFRGVPLGSYNWYESQNSQIAEIWQYRGGVAFYINSETSSSESFSTSTTASSLVSKINSISDISREITFLTGKNGDVLVGSIKGGDDKDSEDKSSTIGDFASGSTPNLISALSSGLNVVVSGGKLMFPEIWQDSQFSRDFNINIRLTSPDCDNLSIFLNIIVPLMHLVAFAAPKNVDVNGYISPFLIRAYYKGMFNCDMGMVTGLNIQRGGDGRWTPSGIPTVVDVSMSIKELYSSMSMNATRFGKSGLYNNIILMDYIANMCGVNLYEQELRRMGQYWYNAAKGGLGALISGSTAEMIYETTIQKYMVDKVTSIFTGRGRQ